MYIFYVKSIFVYIFRILVSLTPISFADQSAKEVFFSSSCWFTFSQIWRWEQRTQFNPRPRQKKLMKTKQIKKFVNLINFIPRVFFFGLEFLNKKITSNFFLKSSINFFRNFVVIIHNKIWQILKQFTTYLHYFHQTQTWYFRRVMLMMM